MVLMPVSAFCQDVPTILDDTFHLSLGSFIVDSDTKLRLDGEAGEQGRVIDWEKSFGEGDVNRFRMDGYWRFAERHKVRALVFSSSRSSSRTFNEDIEWGGETYPASAVIDGEIKFSIYELAYEYAFMRRDNFELDASIGLHYTDFEASLGAEVSSGGSAGNRRIDRSGNIVAWHSEGWSPTLGGRPGPNNPGNQVTGLLAGFEPQPFHPRTPAPAQNAFSNNDNAVPNYVTGLVNGKAEGTGKIATQRVVSHSVRSVFLTGPLRAPARIQNTFAHESFIDEVAASLKVDPVEYRLRHLSDPRLIAVVNAAAKAANWSARPSPSSNRRNGVASGRGMACVLYEGDNGYCSVVAEVDVRLDTGVVTPKRFVIAADVGPISNPDGLKNQLEGGSLQGLSRTLLEEVTWDDEKITSIDWRTYKPLYLGADVPKVEIVLINQAEGEAMGAGETSITVVPAAIANAVFDATGVRLRQVPFTPERVKAALASRT